VVIQGAGVIGLVGGQRRPDFFRTRGPYVATDEAVAPPVIADDALHRAGSS
jgi:hypothetical protein